MAHDVPDTLLVGLDLSALETIRRLGAHEQGELKFTNYLPRILKAWKQALRLNLKKSPPLDILEIGPGGGYFLFVCQHLGHRSIGIDRPGFVVWHNLRQWLGVQCVDHDIRPKTPLPPLGRFDLVVAFYCPFNYVDSDRRFWTLDEWSFFFDHLRNDILKPNGRVVLQIKAGRHGERNQLDDPAFLKLCNERGGTLKKRLLVFEPLL